MTEPAHKKNLLLHSGRIYTQDSSNPFYQAVAICDGKISWLGNNEDLYAIPSDKYEIIDLGGRTILPGFCDSHMHFAYWAWSLEKIDLDGCKSYREVLRKLRKKSKSLKRGEWLTGNGWQPDQWQEVVWPHKKDLDKIAPNHPVALFSKDEHSIWVNSKALQKAGIDRNTSDPEGGEIVRDDRGEPIGILKENAAALIYKHIPLPSGARANQLLKQAQEKAHSLGITALSSFDGIKGFEILQSYNKKFGLKLRIGYYVPSGYLDELLAVGIQAGFGDDNLKINGVKFFADGALGSQTALMFKPYQNSKDNYGIAQTDSETLMREVKKCVQGNLNVAIHAIGDKANYNSINALRNALGKRPKQHRHRIEHCQLLRKQDIPVFGEYNIIGSVQPCHLPPDLNMINKYWGKRGRYAYPFKSLQTNGCALAFGSDAPIEQPGPIWNIHCALNRSNPETGEKLYPVEKIKIYEAVFAQTYAGAYALGSEAEFGSITIGKYADMVIMNKDIHVVSPTEISKVEVCATIFEGAFVYGRENFEEW